MISPKLPLYSRKDKDSRYSINFRCTFCGDSKTNEYKKRGWIYEQKDHLFYKCFNCQKSLFFSNYLKEFDPFLYKEYIVEVFKEKMVAKPPEPFIPHIEKYQKKRIEKFDIFDGIPKISQLPVDHPAKIYIEERKIPAITHHRIFYVDKFMEWVNISKPETYDDRALQYEEPRIVFPFIDQYGYVFGFQGRSLNPDSKNRYITIMLDEDKPKIFGLEQIDFSKRVFVVEGPIDSFFLTNCGAMAGSAGQFDKIFNRLTTIIVFDNEPRNAEIVSQYHKYIDQGWRVCIWPSTIKEKDINEMVSSGLDPDEVQTIIVENSFSGMSAKMKMKDWSKI